MSKEENKDFNTMLNNNKDMPKIVKITDQKGIKKWGGETMVVAPPLYYDKIMKKIPYGKLVTTNMIRASIAKKNNVDITCPLTAGIFINIVAWASYQRDTDITPYWRTIKSNGELNIKYPGGIEVQKEKLESEGHSIINKGKKYYVENYEEKLYMEEL